MIKFCKMILFIVLLEFQNVIRGIWNSNYFGYLQTLILDDREFPNAKANHRQHLEKHATFKQVIPIKNEDIVKKINETYRVQFLKDVVLARLLDDSTFAALNSIIFYNHVDIVSHFQQNDKYLSELFKILSSEEHSAEKKKDVIMFLHELCSIAKSLLSSNRSLFYRYKNVTWVIFW